MTFILENIFFIATIYSLVLLGLALLIMLRTLTLIIPEAKVYDGLERLRRLLLIDGISTFLLTSVAFVILGARFILELSELRIFTFTLVMIFSTIVLIKTVVKYLIYTMHYPAGGKPGSLT